MTRTQYLSRIYELTLRGEALPQSKLTEEKVRAIRRDYQPGIYGRCAGHLAERYGVTRRTIERVLSGQLWAHVT